MVSLSRTPSPITNTRFTALLFVFVLLIPSPTFPHVPIVDFPPIGLPWPDRRQSNTTNATDYLTNTPAT